MAHDLIIDGELVLYGPVGGDWWDDTGFTAMDVLQALAEIEGDVTARLNSGGGVAWEGIAIHNAFKARADKVTIIIDGVAASAASVIAMAGDEVVMRAGSLLMIHNASTITWGDAGVHAKSVGLLDKLDGQISGIYAARTGLDLAEVRALMEAETWMDADEAIARGFAGGADTDTAAKASAFDYRLYAHAPKPLQTLARKLRPPAEQRPWGVPLNAARAAQPIRPAAPAAPVEAHMPDPTPAASSPAPAAPAATNDTAIAAAIQADRARVAAILNHAEAEGRGELAKHLAFETSLDAAAATTLLAKAPKPGAAAPPAAQETPQESPLAHAARRAAAAGLATPAAPAAGGNISILEAAVSRSNGRR